MSTVNGISFLWILLYKDGLKNELAFHDLTLFPRFLETYLLLEYYTFTIIIIIDLIIIMIIKY